MRGLKLRLQARAGRQLQVASFTDAWIETIMMKFIVLDHGVASFTDAWIETTLQRRV